MSKRKQTLPAEIAAASPAVVALYRQCLANGCTERFATMLALQAPPKANTDREFFAGRHNLGQQFAGDRRGLRSVLRGAKKRGFKPPADAIYEPGLARFQGDPEAFIPASGGRGYVKKLLETRGWESEGAVKVRASGSREQDAVALAPDLAKQMLPGVLEKDPKLKRASRREQLAEVARRHGSKV